MDQKEKEIQKKIEEKTKGICVPDRLKPEQMKETLTSKKRGRKWVYQLGTLAAACVVLAVGVWVYQQRKSPEQQKTDALGEISSDGKVAVADSYEEIYDYIQSQNQTNEEATPFAITGGAVEESVSDSAASSAADSGAASQAQAKTAEAAPAEGQHSTTNVRQEGVDEGDIVKTDGTCLYVLKDNGQELSIVNTEGGLKEVGEIKVSEASEEYIQEFYLRPQEKELVLICSFRNYSADLLDTTSGVGANQVLAITYDISDVAAPREIGRVSQSGDYHSSRVSDGYLYLFSSCYTGMEMDPKEPRTYIPIVQGEVMSADSIYMPLVKEGNMFEIITVVDLNNPAETLQSKALFTKGGELYVSNENIYYYETQWPSAGGETEVTTIRRISYEKGKLKAEAQGTLKGYVNDSFSMDEYKGYLRVVTTVGETNAVYILDSGLKTIGKIEGLAKEERVYSARFMGDTGYFVTFRETDPLFTVDLSNPKKPEIIGALKIPGFSEYLHFYGENQLVGVGMDVDAETQATGGVKVTMFDISDKRDVKEAHTYVLENVYSTDLSYDYKAAMIAPEKNLIGFAGYTEGGEKYYLFSYDGSAGFTLNLEEDINGNTSRAARGVYIKDILYVVRGNVIEAYSLKDYTKAGDLIL